MKFFRYFTVVLVFVLLGFFLVHSLDSINQDIGRHLKSGQIIWQTKSVYKTNLFSFTEPDHIFVNHHWLSEVVFFLLNNLVGLKGLIIFKTVLILISFFVLFKSVSKKTGTWPLLISLLTAIFVFIDRTDVRPEIFSYFFLSIFIFAIFRAKYFNQQNWLYFLPIVQIIWTNMHIYFAVGPILIFLFLIDRLISKLPPKNLLWIFILTSASTLINPNFLSGALAPFNILRRYGYTIVENQSISFLKDYGILIKQINIFEFSLVILFLSFVIALKRRRKDLLFEFLGAMFFSTMALKMIRNFGLYALFFAPTVALNLSTGKLPLWLKNKASKLVVCALALIILVFSLTKIANNSFYGWLGTSKEFGLKIPVGAEKGVEFIKENKIQGPVFNNFDVGSFLIWKLYPEQKTFVDGRPEAYSVDFLENVYKRMQQDPALWKKYSEEYKINYIFFDHHDITPWAQTFLQNITKNPQWVSVYLDSSVIILVKNVSANQELIRRISTLTN